MRSQKEMAFAGSHQTNNTKPHLLGDAAVGSEHFRAQREAKQCTVKGRPHVTLECLVWLELQAKHQSDWRLPSLCRVLGNAMAARLERCALECEACNGQTGHGAPDLESPLQ